MPGLNLLMYIDRVPNDSTSLVKAVSIPLIIEAMSITVTTPMITPTTVRNERSLFARSVPRAIQRFSKMSLRKSFIQLRSYSDPHCKLKIVKCKFQNLRKLVPQRHLGSHKSAIFILQFSIPPYHVSARNASIGSSRAAFHAGTIPERTPTPPEAVRANRIASSER